MTRRTAAAALALRGLLLCLALIGAFLICGCEAPISSTGPPVVLIYPLPSALTKYVPALYDDFGSPIRSTDDPLAGPVLWLWPNGVVNLCAAEFVTYYPLKQAFPAPVKGHYEWRFNFAAHALEGVHLGWIAEDSAAVMNDASSGPMAGFGPPDLPAPIIRGARFRLEAVATYPAGADSVLEGWAELDVQLGAERDTLRTFVRLVHEAFGR